MSTNGNGLTVLGLHIENVKRVKVVDLTPPATGAVKIRGKNRAGKSSTIDSIGMAISTDEIPDMPIRSGEKEGSIVLRLGAGLDEKYIVKKTFTGKGSYLSVTAKHDGQLMKMASPQKFLDDLRGARVAFDPREFCAAKPADQVQMLLSVLQLPEDPRKLDGERASLYARRTEVNRQVSQAKAVLDAENGKPLPEAPEEEVSVSSLVAELDNRQAEVLANESLRKNAAEAERSYRLIKEGCERDIREARNKVTGIEEQIARLQENLSEARNMLAEAEAGSDGLIAEAQDTAQKAANACAGLTDPDVSEIKAQIQTAEQTNRAVRIRKGTLEQRAGLAKRHADVSAQAAELTTKIEAIDQRKADIYAQAAFPIEGLSIAQDAKFLTYHGTPVSQCSDSEQMEIGMSINAALSPRLRIILIREASLMDEETQARVHAWARTHDFQVWEEIVGTDGDGFVIEDGAVKEKQPALL